MALEKRRGVDSVFPPAPECVTPRVPAFENNINNTQTVGESIAGVSNTPVDASIEAMLFNFINEQNKKQKAEEASVYDFNKVLNSFKTGDYLSDLTDNMFENNG